MGKHQNIEGLEKIREQNRLRKQKQRKTKLLDSHVTSRDSHATDIEEDKEVEEEREKEVDKDIFKNSLITS